MKSRIIKYIVVKPFPSHDAKRIYSEGDTYSGGESLWTKRLLENGFIRHIDAYEVEKAGPEPEEYNPEIVATSKWLNIAIAKENYSEGDKKYFTYDEALAIEKKLVGTGWRLPTRHEWVILSEEFGNGVDGRISPTKFGENLKLEYAGVVADGSLQAVGSGGYYWSSTAYSSNYAYYLYFNSSDVYTSTRSRYYGYSVRPVKDIK